MADSTAPEVKTNGATPAAKTVTPQSLVTEAHVRAALAADKGAAALLKDWKVVDFAKKGDNYLSVMSSVEVKFLLDGQSSEVTYVVKINPCTNYKSMEEFIRVIFMKEANAYLSLIPELNSVLKSIGHEPLRVPKCFHASLEKDKEIIFLEDLRVRGFQMVNKRRGLDVAHAFLVLQELARFHAASILLQAKTPGQDLKDRYEFLNMTWPDFITNKSNLGCDKLFLDSFEGQLSTGEKILTKVGGYERSVNWTKSVRSQFKDVILKMVENPKYKVVIHGDCWSNNMLFRYSEAGLPVEVMLLDLQMTSQSSPAIELNNLMFTSLPGEVRKPNLETFLATYHSTFSGVVEAGAQQVPFTQEQLRHEFRDKNLYGVLLAMLVLPTIVLTDPEKVMDFTEGSDDTMQEMLQSIQDNAMETLDTNPFLKSRFLCMFDEMMEAGVIP